MPKPKNKKEEPPFTYISAYWDGEKEILATDMTPEEHSNAATNMFLGMLKSFYEPKGYTVTVVDN